MDRRQFLCRAGTVAAHWARRSRRRIATRSANRSCAVSTSNAGCSTTSSRPTASIGTSRTPVAGAPPRAACQGNRTGRRDDCRPRQLFYCGSVLGQRHVAHRRGRSHARNVQRQEARDLHQIHVACRPSRRVGGDPLPRASAGMSRQAARSTSPRSTPDDRRPPRLASSVLPCFTRDRSAPAARRSSTGCGRRAHSSFAGSWRGKCPASPRNACRDWAASRRMRSGRGSSRCRPIGRA